jgi:hypothetical protein
LCPESRAPEPHWERQKAILAMSEASSQIPRWGYPSESVFVSSLSQCWAAGSLSVGEGRRRSAIRRSL